MASDPEDDALSWAGDDTLEPRRPAPRRRDVPVPPSSAGTSPSAESSSSVADAATGPVDARGDAVEEPVQMSTAALVLLGVFGGIYLLYTVGWLLGGLGMQSRALFMLPAPLYLAGMWIAVAAPALWFTAVLVLTRRSAPWLRAVGLVVGALLLVPWPFVIAGGGGVL